MKSRATGNARLDYGQNFLVNPPAVRRLVEQARFTADDLVLEIGPGEGIITRELARTAGRVRAIEIDPTLAAKLQASLADHPNLTIEQGDFLKIDLPGQPFFIFANIPFNITAPIMHRLWDNRQPLQAAYLIMQREAAEKFTAITPTTESAVLFQPWFGFEVSAHINRFEFRPVPAVDAVLLHLWPLDRPLLAPGEKRRFFRFVTHGFRAWKKNLKIAYKEIFSYNQWKRLSKDNRFAIDARPSELALEQWLALYRYFQTGVSDDKKRKLFS